MRPLFGEQPFILTIYEFFYIKLSRTVRLLPVEILWMNPGQTGFEEVETSARLEAKLL